jgi:hypothetical protein
MVMVLRFTRVNEFMKDNGKMTNGMVMAMKCSRMVTYIMAPIIKVNLMEKVYIPGQMAKSMTGSGSWASKMGMESGEVKEAIHILVSGLMVKLRVMEYIFGKIKINMKVNGARI